MSTPALRSVLLACALLTRAGDLRAERAHPAAPANRSSEVRVTEVGHSNEWRELELVLRDFLLPHGLEPIFEARAALGRLDAPEQAASNVPRVWIELVSSERARLVLSDATRGRYLLREVPLDNGLDEVGRETLSQVIEASLLALRGQGRVLSRNELDRLLDAAVVTPSPAAPGAEPMPQEDSQPKQQVLSAVATRAKRDSGGGSRVQLAAAYLMQWTGPELGLLHGPALRLEAEVPVGGGTNLSVALTGEAPLSQGYQSSLVNVKLRSNAVWLTAGIKQSWGGALLLVAAAGPGVTGTTISPSAVAGGLARVQPKSWDTTLWFRGELGVERRFTRLRLAASLLSDVSGHDTHYDVSRGGRVQTLVVPWAVRPGLRVAVGWGN